MLNALLPTRRSAVKMLTPGPLAGPAPGAALPDFSEPLKQSAERARESGADPARALLEATRPILAEGEAAIRDRFLAGETTAEACLAERARLIDALVVALADTASTVIYPVHNPTMSERLAIVAVGGYGRGELAPFSDVDLLFLLPYKRSPVIEQIVECMLYVLWDTGLKVGNATRSLTDCLRYAEKDVTVRTGLLDARPLWGDAELWAQLERGFDKQFSPSTGHQFAVAKLAERDERHRRMGDSRYILEPNIKEGKGGLRDLHTLYWIGKYFFRDDAPNCLVEAGVLTPEEARVCRKARRFLSAVRCHLHYLTGRADEVLTFDVQPEMARRLAYGDREGVRGVERFMKHYFLIAKEVGDLTRVVCAGLEIDSRPRGPRRFLPFADKLAFANETVELDRFVMRQGRLDLKRADQLKRSPLDVIRIFQSAQANNLAIHPRALKQCNRVDRAAIAKLRNNAEANALFLEILCGPRNPEAMLRQMSEAGVLGRFVPDFGRIIAQMQYDMYHVYTVDEHTIRAVSILHDIGAGQVAEKLPLASRLMGELSSRRALIVAIFLHDIAKGRGGDHSILGARVARRLCPRFGLAEEECETVEWLVLHHLDMSNVAFRRDMEDEKTVRDFAEAVESPERLRLLTVLTTADINAVGPGRWTSWKASLIGQLFSRTMERLSGGQDSALRFSSRVERSIQAFRAHASQAGWSAEDIEKHVAIGHPSYWLSYDAETQLHHAEMARGTAGQTRPLEISWREVAERGLSEITVYAEDHPGLCALIAGAVTAAGGVILDARLMTLANGMALDVFSIQNPPSDGAGKLDGKLDRVCAMIAKTLRGEVVPRTLLEGRAASATKRTQAFSIAPRVVIDNQASNHCTVIEVNGRDRPGVLYGLAAALSDAGLRIASAKIATFGERVVDVFYVKDIFGLKVYNEVKLAQVQEALIAVFEPPAEEDRKTAPARAAKKPAGPRRKRPKSPAAARSKRAGKAKPAKDKPAKDKNAEPSAG